MISNTQQEDFSFEREMEYFHTYQKACGFKAIWSMYGEDIKFGNEHPWYDNSKEVWVRYSHKPDFDVKTKVLGRLWADIYWACDDVIQKSEDLHHLYIEGFEVQETQHQIILNLYTGS